MKEVKQYICDICGTAYKEKAKCEECERSHRSPKKVESCRWLPVTQNRSGYPNSINVKMDNGEVITYKR